jgi:hypothetical protein
MRLAELHGKQKRECNARSGHESQYKAWRTRAGAMVGVAEPESSFDSQTKCKLHMGYASREFKTNVTVP